MEVLTESFAMNGGNGPHSYAQNSSYQRGAVEAAKDIITQEVAEKLDVKEILSDASSTFTLVDFGCSTGPNTVLAVQVILEAIQGKLKTCGLNSQNPEFMVFFNDQTENDFDSLFASLPPTRQFYAASVPGSFYGRLFPKASLHFAYSSCALCWLSKLPREVMEKTSPSWNEGRIHYTGAPKEVFEAYARQFREDMESFLSARAEELVSRGLMTLLVPAVPDVILQSQTNSGSEFEVLGSCLVDMAKMGIISKEKVDTFNLPVYYTRAKELREIIDQNGSYSIERMETLKNAKEHITMPNFRQRALYLRAVFEGLIEKHFGSRVIDELFERYSSKVAESSFFLNPSNQKSTILFVLLKRNAC